MVELFCGDNSALGRITKESVGCDVVRVDEHLDMLQRTTQRNIVSALSTENASVWISAPCTGGTWYNNHVNWHRHPSARKGIEDKQKQFYQFLVIVTNILREVKENGFHPSLFSNYPTATRIGIPSHCVNLCASLAWDRSLSMDVHMVWLRSMVTMRAGQLRSHGVL